MNQLSLPSSDLLFEMAFLIECGGRPCYFKDIHLTESEGKTLRGMKDILLIIKRRLPCVKFYIRKSTSERDGVKITTYMFFMYRFPFQKEVFKHRFTVLPINETLFSWSEAGLLFGYSPQEIQNGYDINKKKFGEIFV